MMQVLERLAHRPSCIPSTRKDYLRKVSPFVAEHPDPQAWTEVTAQQWLEQLLGHGWKPASVDNVGDILKVLYKTWGRPPLALRRYCTSRAVIDQARPGLTLEEFGRLIRVSLAFPWPEVRSFVAVASIYGARRGELAALQSTDIHLTERQITIPTLKHEDVRVHRLPTVLCQVMDPAHFAGKHSVQVISGYWPLLERMASITHRERQGWHAVRRGLVRRLAEAGVPNEVSDTWMGWAVASRSMGARYRMELRPDLDAAVFEKHPILPLWEVALQEVQRGA